ncbi:MAG: hypothetical protein KC731_09925, partial [Myxococcales bacterium]|nr:hypothetical protein [Myxococcales bacterium]
MRGTIFITLGLAAVLAHGACGDDTGTGGTGGTGGTNTGVGDGGTETTALAVTVEDEEGTPIAGATCAVQIANGTPVEATTGADGVAAFDLEGWTEPASVSCAMINVTALLGLLPEDVSDGELTLALETLAPPISPPEMVQVTGSILNPVQTGSDHHFFGVSHAYEMGTWEGSATSYFLSVPKGVPFDLLGYEVTYTNPPAQTMNQTFLAWTVVHHDGLDQNGTLDVDLGATVQPLTAAGTLARPTRADSPFTQDDARMVMHVLDRKETRYVGFGTSTAFTNDGRASYTSESVDSFLTPEQVVTTFQLKTNSYARSFVTLDGYPPSGDLETAFL